MSDFGLARKLYYEVYHKNVTNTVCGMREGGGGREGEMEGDGDGRVEPVNNGEFNVADKDSVAQGEGTVSARHTFQTA